MTAFLLGGSLMLILGGQFNLSWKHLQPQALFVFLVVALGPGLFVNVIFKPHWGRPRPREILEFGGHQIYQSVLSPNLEGPGMSFPCGHCSVGFSFAVFAWLLRRKNPVLAAGLFLTSIILGLLMGLGRMADGGHFASDVVFSGLIVSWVSFVFYHFVLKLSGDAQNMRNLKWPQGRSSRLLSVGAAAVATIAILGIALVATPFKQDFDLEPEDSNFSQIQVQIDQANLEISWDPTTQSAVHFLGQSRGFAFPKSSVRTHCETVNKILKCKIQKKGLFSDYESNLKITLNPRLVNSLDVSLKKGEVIPLGQTPDGFVLKVDHEGHDHL